jgi:hypothetical protein
MGNKNLSKGDVLYNISNITINDIADVVSQDIRDSFKAQIKQNSVLKCSVRQILEKLEIDIDSVVSKLSSYIQEVTVESVAPYGNDDFSTEVAWLSDGQRINPSGSPYYYNDRQTAVNKILSLQINQHTGNSI